MNEELKKARLAKNLSQAELARRVGVSRQTVNMIEN
ncbi:MAG: helix-turn-helix transcriptional regulator, partial [Candidatus Borkfalkiaceae bacterium]|nr:helix-turn-helix transcriptional regulator [Christensenellaceae bacterium]